MKVSATAVVLILFFGWLPMACHLRQSPNGEMAAVLGAIRGSEAVPQNGLFPAAGLPFYDSLIRTASDKDQLLLAMTFKADLLIKLGREQHALGQLDTVLRFTDKPAVSHLVRKIMAIAWLRIGERANCLYNHTTESCLFPIRGSGIHTNKTGSSRAIELYEGLLREDSADLESRWLLNIAYMTIGQYPSGVPGDAYQSLLFVNPGQNGNHWISLDLEGVRCNRAAIGARIKLSFLENGVRRAVYKDVNSGGSFGANPLRQHLGVGMAEVIDSLEIRWPGSSAAAGLVQVFKNIRVDQFLRIREGNATPARIPIKAFKIKPALIDCAPLRVPQASVSPLPPPGPTGAHS